MLSRDAAFLTLGVTGEEKPNHDPARRQIGEAACECGAYPGPNDIEEEDFCAPEAVPSCSSDHICDYVNGHQYSRSIIVIIITKKRPASMLFHRLVYQRLCLEQYHGQQRTQHSHLLPQRPKIQQRRRVLN